MSIDNSNFSSFKVGMIKASDSAKQKGSYRTEEYIGVIATAVGPCERLHEEGINNQDKNPRSTNSQC